MESYLEKESKSLGVTHIHPFITMIEWIRTTRLSINNFLPRLDRHLSLSPVTRLDTALRRAYCMPPPLPRPCRFRSLQGYLARKKYPPSRTLQQDTA